MRVLVTGSTGLIGSALVERLRQRGDEAVRVVRARRNLGESEALWNPETGSIERDALDGLDAAVHLAGESVAGGRWTREKKGRIRDSRLRGTRLLSQTLSSLQDKPRVLVSASAIGIYGNRGDEIMREDSPPADDFLADVCKEWEAATIAAQRAGIRVVRIRIGVVLSTRGGALAQMLTPFRFGLGGVVGSGRQYMSWIALDDIVNAILFCIENDTLSGPVNGMAPNPATNRDFTKVLGKVLRRPTLFPLPAFAVRALFGEMGNALLLASTRGHPTRLLEAGFRFDFPDLEPALRHLLGQQ